MPEIKAEIILDSVNPAGDRLTTALWTGPRYMLAEINTHRMLSRNSASSRAIPTAKLQRQVEEDPVLPAFWGSNQPGMQSYNLMPETEARAAEGVWRQLAMFSAAAVRKLTDLGLHKQWANRPLEAFMPHTMLVSATEWTNFFALRAHKAALPDLQVLAYRFLDAYLKSTPNKLGWGEWHIPYGDRMPEGISHEQKLKISTARAARLSYMTFDGDIDPDKDYTLHDGLVGESPRHASPTEHMAYACPSVWLNKYPGGLQVDSDPDYADNLIRTDIGTDGVPHGNYFGWTQYRKQITGENVTELNLEEVLANKPDWITL